MSIDSETDRTRSVKFNINSELVSVTHSHTVRVTVSVTNRPSP